jgi:hypothetical protein
VAIRRLYNAIKAFGTNPAYLRADQPTSPTGAAVARSSAPGGEPFVVRATVQAVYDQSGALILVQGDYVDALQATDEPLRAGQDAWVSQAQDGTWLIHGSVK